MTIRKTAGQPDSYTGRIRKATQKDVSALTWLLCAGFDNDPVINWFMRDDSRLAEGFAACFGEFVLQSFVPMNETYTTEDHLGVAVWGPPPGKMATSAEEWEQLKPLMRRISGRRIGRFERLMHVTEEKHPDTPHYYLFNIAVHPSIQGRGVGSALIRQMTQRLDREKMPAYLESTKAINVSLYERHGFNVVEKLSFGDGAVPLWRMWRDPQ